MKNAFLAFLCVRIPWPNLMKLCMHEICMHYVLYEVAKRPLRSTLHTLDCQVNVPVRLLIFGKNARGTLLLGGSTLINISSLPSLQFLFLVEFWNLWWFTSNDRDAQFATKRQAKVLMYLRILCNKIPYVIYKNWFPGTLIWLRYAN